MTTQKNIPQSEGASRVMRHSNKRVRRSGGLGLLLRRLLPVFVLALAIGGVVVMGGAKPEPEEKEASVKALPVLVATPRAERARLFVQTQGEVRPRTDIKLVPQVGGKITYVAPAFIEGGAFVQGELLVKIEQKEYQLRLVQARANVAQMRTRLTSEQAEAALAKKEASDLGLGRGSALALREPQLAEAQAMLASAEAAFEETELQLQRTAIRAPFAGRVSQKTVGLGEYVSPGMMLGQVFSVDLVDVKIPLTDDELGELGIGIGFKHSPVTPGPMVLLSANVAGLPHQWQGRLTRTDSGYDPKTRVLFAYIEVVDPYGRGADEGTPLAPGLFVTARIEGREINNAQIVPRTALRGKDQVYIAKEDGTLEIRQVQVASSDRTRVVLVGGVTGEEKIITSPVRGVASGMKIEIVSNAGAALSPDKPINMADGEEETATMQPAKTN